MFEYHLVNFVSTFLVMLLLSYSQTSNLGSLKKWDTAGNGSNGADRSSAQLTIKEQSTVFKKKKKKTTFASFLVAPNVDFMVMCAVSPGCG